MTYKDKLYAAYVSSGQSGVATNFSKEQIFSSKKYYIEKIIKNQLFTYDKNIKIVDIGCGYGMFIYYLHEMGFKNAIGVDISKEQIDLGKNLGISNLYCLDMNEFLVQNPHEVDVFLLIDIVEHLTFDEIFVMIEKLKSKMTENSILIIHIPNAEGLFGMRVRYGDITHETAFTPKSINQLLKTLGFGKVECFEDKPIIHGVKSFLRRIAWDLITIYYKFLLMIETGETKFILSQNMTVIAQIKK